jgi:hypothetical protein
VLELADRLVPLSELDMRLGCLAPSVAVSGVERDRLRQVTPGLFRMTMEREDATEPEERVDATRICFEHRAITFRSANEVVSPMLLHRVIEGRVDSRDFWIAGNALRTSRSAVHDANLPLGYRLLNA